MSYRSDRGGADELFTYPPTAMDDWMAGRIGLGSLDLAGGIQSAADLLRILTNVSVDRRDIVTSNAQRGDTGVFDSEHSVSLGQGGKRLSGDATAMPRILPVVHRQVTRPKSTYVISERPIGQNDGDTGTFDKSGLLTEGLQMALAKQARDWFEYHELKNAGVPVSPPAHATAQQVATTPQIVATEEESEMAVDWGTFLQDSAQMVLRAKLADKFNSDKVIFPSGGSSGLPYSAGGAIGATPAILPQAGAAAGAVGGYLLNEFGDVIGQIGTAKKRRRRRRLLTPTDLADLAQLQVLVGKGSESMKFAVMKAVRR